MNEDYLPIPSANNRYEICKAGKVRNARTKKLLKPYKNNVYTLYLKKKCRIKRTQAQLLWEVHGRLPKINIHPVPVTLRKDAQAFYFESKNKAAEFLRIHTNYSFDHMRTCLCEEYVLIAGWEVKYHIPKIEDWGRKKRRKSK